MPRATGGRTSIQLSRVPRRTISSTIRRGRGAFWPTIPADWMASLSGKAGDYKYGNPMDQHFFGFIGLTQDALLEQVKTGASDWDILLWVNAHANPKRPTHEVRAWSAYLETMPVGDAGDLEWFAAQARRLNPERTDLQTIMDFLDADDHVSFGGQA